MNEKYPDVCEVLRQHGVICACIMFKDGSILDIDCSARCREAIIRE